MNELALARLQLPSRPSDRALLICVACSIALHAAVLMMSPRHREGSAAPGETVMKARLLPRDAVQASTPEPPPPVEALKPVPPPQPIKPPVAQPVPKPVQQTPLTTPTPSPAAPRIAAPEPVTSSPAAPASPPVAAPAPPAAAPNPPAARAPGTPAGEASAGTTEGIDPNALAALKVTLGEVLKKKFAGNYPALARERQWEGRVAVRVTIQATGRSGEYRIITSSEHDVLDNDALRRVRIALPEALLRMPPVLRGKEFPLDVVIDFKLAE